MKMLMGIFHVAVWFKNNFAEIRVYSIFENPNVIISSSQRRIKNFSESSCVWECQSVYEQVWENFSEIS